jgi:hypothetical protein
MLKFFIEGTFIVCYNLMCNILNNIENHTS